MLTSDQVRAALDGYMRWKTPAGATSIEGYDFLPKPAPPPPQVDPSQFIPTSGTPNGYAEMFQSPLMQQAMGTLQAMGTAPAGGPQGAATLSPTPQVTGSAPSAPVAGAVTLAPEMPGQVPMPRPRPQPPAPTPMPGRPAALSKQDSAPTPMPGRPRILSDETVGKLGEKTHTIKKGDTLWDIARANGTTVKALVKKNHLKNPNSVPVGTTLKL